MPKPKQNIKYVKLGSARKRRDGRFEVDVQLNKFLSKHPNLTLYTGDLRKEPIHFKTVYKLQYLPHYYHYDDRKNKFKRTTSKYWKTYATYIEKY